MLDGTVSIREVRAVGPRPRKVGGGGAPTNSRGSRRASSSLASRRDMNTIQTLHQLLLRLYGLRTPSRDHRQLIIQGHLGMMV